MRVLALFLVLIAPFLITCGKKPELCQPANAGPDKIIKQGETIEIGANDTVPGVAYSWMPQSETESPKTAKTKVSPRQTAVYLLRVKNSCAVSFDYVRVKVK